MLRLNGIQHLAQSLRKLTDSLTANWNTQVVA